VFGIHWIASQGQYYSFHRRIPKLSKGLNLHLYLKECQLDGWYEEEEEEILLFRTGNDDDLPLNQSELGIISTQGMSYYYLVIERNS
jgi:hypothetical protein